MRNTIFVLALAIGAVVHFTHRLFPSLTSLAASARLERPYNPPAQPHYLGGNKSGPSLRSAVWTEKSASDSLPCLVRRTGGPGAFEDAPSCQHLGEPTRFPQVAVSCYELDSVPGRYCRF